MAMRALPITNLPSIAKSTQYELAKGIVKPSTAAAIKTSCHFLVASVTPLDQYYVALFT